MTASATNAPLTVSTDGAAGPYVIVTPELVKPVAAALHAEGVCFHVDEEAVRLNGMPALALIDLGPGADAGRVQRVLDRITANLQAKGEQRRPRPTRKELVIRGSSPAMQELGRRLGTAAPIGGWERQGDVEERFRKTLDHRVSVYCFSKRIPDLRREIAVLLQGRGPGEDQDLYVSGVVPLEGREALGLEQHDQVVFDFRNTLVEPLIRNLNIRLLDYRVNVEPALEEVLSPDALVRLHSFSAVANKGHLHSLDLQRWAAFIAQTHRDDAVIALDVLASWLEDEGFSPEQRDRLLTEYESGRRILSAYDVERAS